MWPLQGSGMGGVGCGASRQRREESLVSKGTKTGIMEDSFPSLATKVGREVGQKYAGQGNFVVMACFVLGMGLMT